MANCRYSRRRQNLARDLQFEYLHLMRYRRLPRRRRYRRFRHRLMRPFRLFRLRSM
jgi:hypothetical protein